MPAATGCQPQDWLNESTRCSPRPDSATQSGSRVTGPELLGSLTAQTTCGARRTRLRRISGAGFCGVSPNCLVIGPGPLVPRLPQALVRCSGTLAAASAWRSALVTSSLVTNAMSSKRSPRPQRFNVSLVNSRAVRTDSSRGARAQLTTSGSVASAGLRPMKSSSHKGAAGIAAEVCPAGVARATPDSAASPNG